MLSTLVLAAALIGPETGFTALFNGTDLHGWQGDTVGYQAINGTISVAPGAVDPGAEGNTSPGFLYTTGQWDNFELRFEFKLTPGANNGLALRWSGQGNPAYDGMEVQILDNPHPSYAKLKAYQYHGSVYGVAAARRGCLRPTGEWNDETVICDGPRVTVILNGHVITDVNIQEALQQGTLDGQHHPGLGRTGGHIGFCGHGSAVAFRAIRIRPLTSPAPDQSD
jgi:hypothetical protein